jgi:hypothetical protein
MRSRPHIGASSTHGHTLNTRSPAVGECAVHPLLVMDPLAAPDLVTHRGAATTPPGGRDGSAIGAGCTLEPM